MTIGSKNFSNYTYIMAIINLTPDSFWQGSRAAADSALFAAERAVKEGAALLDIGAQSTRPGYTEVSAEEEISRLERPLGQIVREFDVPVSVDTYYPRVARFALQLGAQMINDVSGLSHAGMTEVISSHAASVCIMHNSSAQITGDVFPPVIEFLQSRVSLAVNAGVPRDKICLDGGIGFGKSRQANLDLLDGYGRLKSLGYPLLLGCSRKSLFGGRVEDRLPQTLAATRAAAEAGVLFVRVHDVKQNVEEIRKVYEN